MIHLVDMRIRYELAFCLAEDRTDCETGLRLAILSLRRHVPEAPIFVYRPSPTPDFVVWLRKVPQVTLIPNRPEAAESWNCKPHALRPLLAQGYRQVVWLDSDVIVTRDVRAYFGTLSEQTMVSAQEPRSLPHQGLLQRTLGWGLEPGRNLPITLNSAVLRVTQEHASILSRWIECMRDPRYTAAQALPLEQRPLHMMGDQDVLNALLGAKEFASVPIRVLETGVDIIHAGGALGYSLHERLSGLLRAKPAYVHATAGKPWLWLGNHERWSRADFVSWHRRLLQEVSPYVAEARKYRDEMEVDTAWMDRASGVGIVLRALGLGHYALRGLPITLVATLLRALSNARRAA